CHGTWRPHGRWWPHGWLGWWSWGWRSLGRRSLGGRSLGWRSQSGDDGRPFRRLARRQLASRGVLPSWTVRTSPSPVLFRRSTGLCRVRIWLSVPALGIARVG